jgi:hypothetical protein
LLKLMGHEIAKSEWSDLSKSVVWTAATVGFLEVSGLVSF